jgi:type IV pilus assembly protein PilM
VAKQTVGLKIGASQLTAACLDLNGEARLVQVAREPLAPGIVTGGEVRDVPALAETLKDFFKRHGLPRRSVRIGIANNRIGVLTGVDLEAFALLRALTPPANLGMLDRSALVAVAIGAERSTLAVSDGFSCEFTRVLEWGGAALTGALARSLNIDPVAAEELKTRLSLEAGQVPDGVTIEEATQAREALRGALNGFARELVSSLQFYQSQPDSLGIREVVLAGGTAQLGGLAAALEQLVGVSVRIGDPLVGVSVGKKVKGDAPPVSLAVPIGLGMAL